MGKKRLITWAVGALVGGSLLLGLSGGALMVGADTNFGTASAALAMRLMMIIGGGLILAAVGLFALIVLVAEKE